MLDDKQPITDNIIRLKQISELSSELVDTVYTLLDAIISYCKKNNLPIHEEEGLWNLVKKSRAIFKEIEEVSSSNFKPRSYYAFGHKNHPTKVYTEQIRRQVYRTLSGCLEIQASTERHCQHRSRMLKDSARVKVTYFGR